MTDIGVTPLGVASTGQLPLHKGYFGVQYRTQIGLHRLSPTTTSPTTPFDPSWDVFVGPLPFLLANSETDPYLRESTPVRRERFDTPRDNAENVLDARLWVRSWTSWHMGAGQPQAEPLEQSPEPLARFRFGRSAGVDVWQAGRLTLLRQPVQRVPSGVRRCVGVPGKGVVTSTDTGVRLVTESGGNSPGSTVGTGLAVTSARWAVVGDDGALHYGDLDGSGAATATGLTGPVTAVTTAKERLWVGAGPRLYEVTDIAAATHSLAHTFPDGQITDIDSGAGGVYVMVVGAVTTIHVVTVATDGTLNPPVEVAVLPRGETGRLLYGYLSRYLVVGTSEGVRIADCSEPSVLPMGPLTVDMTGQGCVDAVADGNFIYVTCGDEGIDTLADGTEVHPGLYRLDLSRLTMPGQDYGDTAASRYAWATDLYAPTTGATSSVTAFGGRIWFAAGGQLWMGGDEPMAQGWLETGEVSYTTAERKAWQSLMLDVAGTGSVVPYTDTGGGFRPASQTLLTVPFTGDVLLDTRLNPASTWLNLRVALVGGIWVNSFGVRAMPSPRRTRFVRLPLSAYDHQVDRNQVPVGYDGFAFDRVADLEALEVAGEVVTVTDMRTGESLSGQIERVTFTGMTSPDRVRNNYGGVCQVTIVTV